MAIYIIKTCTVAVTRGWNGYRNKSQHRKLTLEKKILPPLHTIQTLFVTQKGRAQFVVSPGQSDVENSVKSTILFHLGSWHNGYLAKG